MGPNPTIGLTLGGLERKKLPSLLNLQIVVELDVDDVGPVLRNATAKVTRATRGDSGYNGGGGAPMDDPWAAPVASEEPPF